MNPKAREGLNFDRLLSKDCQVTLYKKPAFFHQAYKTRYEFLSNRLRQMQVNLIFPEHSSLKTCIFLKLRSKFLHKCYCLF